LSESIEETENFTTEVKVHISFTLIFRS